MPEIDRFVGGRDRFELEFLEREATPEPAMKLRIRLHLAGLSVSDTITILDRLGVDRCRSTVHNRVQKADPQPLDGANPDHVAVDETVIQLNDERYWPSAAVDAATNRLLHVRLFPTRTRALTEMFLSELREKHLVDDAIFLVDGTPWLQAACHRHGLRFHHETQGTRNAVERVFREVIRRTNQFSNCFSHAESENRRKLVASVRLRMESAYPNTTDGTRGQNRERATANGVIARPPRRALSPLSG